MPNSQCAAVPAFSISGEQFFTDTSVNFQANFDIAGDEDNVQAFQWFLDDLLVSNIPGDAFSGNVACGTHKVGLRILSENNWSGIKELGFVTCQLTETQAIIGPVVITGGQSAAYQVIGTFSDGTTIDLTPSYTFTASGGGTFSGNVFTADPLSSDEDYLTETITATKGSSVLTEPIRIDNADYADAGFLVIDFFNYEYLDIVGYIGDADVAKNYQPAYTGNNTIWDETPPRQPLILASDFVTQPTLNWRFEFNLGRLKSNYPNKPNFTFYIAGKAATAFKVNGSINVINMRGTMLLVGSPGSYLPTVTGGQDLYDITPFTSQVAKYDTQGNYNIADLQTILKIEFAVASNTFVKTTSSGSGTGPVI